jgi:hypothetical protein
LGEDIEKEFFVEARQVAVGGDGEQFVCEIHQDAVIAGGVVGDVRPLRQEGREAYEALGKGFSRRGSRIRHVQRSIERS